MKTVAIHWKTNEPWNELCARIIDRYGLPGNLYTTEISDDRLQFHFKDDKDAFLCQLLLSEHLTSA